MEKKKPKKALPIPSSTVERKGSKKINAPSISIPHPYVCRLPFIKVHESFPRFKVIVAHRGAGKTFSTAHELIFRALSSPRLYEGKSPRYFYVATTYDQAKNLIWNYLKRAAEPVRPYIAAIDYNESELTIKLRIKPKEEDKAEKYCALIKLFGAERKPETLEGIHVEGGVLDQAAKMLPNIWEQTLNPMLGNSGGWAIITSTVFGKNYFYDLYQRGLSDNPEWGSLMVKAETAGILPPAEIARYKKEMLPALFAQEYECDFSAAILQGAYYRYQLSDIKSRINDSILWDKTLPVYTSWDIGTMYTAVWFFQMKGNDVRFIDFYEEIEKDIPHYIEVMKSKPYLYDTVFLPHDCKTIVEGVFQRFNFKVEVLEKDFVSNRIQTTKGVLKRCSFNETACQLGLHHLSHYRCAYNPHLGLHKDVPLKDGHDHASDAFGYGCVAIESGLVYSELEEFKKMSVEYPTQGYEWFN